MNTMTKPRLARAGGRAHAAVFLGLALLAVTVCAVAFPAPASAFQFNATVRGKVTGPDGKPLQDVKVTIRKRAEDPTRPTEPFELTTDEDGNYYARNVWLGDVIFVFEYPGMEVYEQNRELRAGPVRIDVEMQAVEVPEEFVRAQLASDAYGAAADAFNAGNFDEAIAQVDVALTALEDTPENAEARSHIYALLGAAYMRQREFGDAIEAFNTRLEYAPDDAAAHLDLAQALGESGDDAAARPHYEAALALDPDDPATQYNVGVTMVNAGDIEAGIAHIETAIALQPVYPLAYKNIGYAYARIEAYQKAVDAFEKYLEQEPESDDAAQIRDFITALKEMIG